MGSMTLRNFGFILVTIAWLLSLGAYIREKEAYNRAIALGFEAANLAVLYQRKYVELGIVCGVLPAEPEEETQSWDGTL